MIRIWSQFIGGFLLVVLTRSVATGAFFSDVEGSNQNTLTAFALDAEVVGDGSSSPICSDGVDETGVQLTAQNSGPLAFDYSLKAQNFGGAPGYCGGLVLTAFVNGEEVYSGPLTAFVVEDLALDPAESDTWEFIIKTDGSSISGSCTWDTVMTATQQHFLSGEAFYDTEVTSQSVTEKIEGCGGTPPPGETVLLVMDKHISGETRGFVPGDFSYLVTGSGVHMVVPHGGSIALGVGTYSIEELVPEGFVKADWRIGWYGACKRGSTFVTSIKIGAGNVDHGTLDCQADNQYRPGHGDANESLVEDGGGESDVQIEEEEGDSEPVRDTRPPRTGRATSAAGAPQVLGEEVDEVSEVTEEEPPVVTEDSEPTDSVIAPEPTDPSLE